MRAGPNLKLIANFGTGVDNIDVKTALDKGITVTNTPGVLTEDTADMTMALILAVPRRLVEGVEGARSRSLQGLVADLDARPPHLRASGSASSAWAASARRWRGAPRRSACRSTITTASPSIPTSSTSSRRPIGKASTRCWRAWTSSSINCPHTPATYHLLSARRLKLMKPTAYIVNTARGEVIDENTLARMLEAGQLAGAGLDVFEHEPAVNPKLLKLKNVVLLPHMGSATIEGRIDMGEKVIINIKTFADGHKPPDRVIPAML